MTAPHVPGEPAGPATVAAQLRLGAGFNDSDRARVLDVLAALDARLATFPAAGTDLELSVKDRGRRGQRVTLECWIPGLSRRVATSTQRTMAAALAEVRDDVRRQLNDAKTRSEPRNNRHLRSLP